MTSGTVRTASLFYTTTKSVTIEKSGGSEIPKDPSRTRVFEYKFYVFYGVCIRTDRHTNKTTHRLQKIHKTTMMLPSFPTRLPTQQPTFKH
jgi:hypothetical protein